MEGKKEAMEGGRGTIWGDKIGTGKDCREERVKKTRGKHAAIERDSSAK